MTRIGQSRWFPATSLLIGAGIVFSLFAVVWVAGCSSVTTTLTGGAAVAYANAQRKEEKARALEDRAERRQALQEAYQAYLGVIEMNPTGKFANRARYRAAKIQTALVVPGGANYQEAERLLNEIIDIRPSGYLAGLAKSDLAAIKKNRDTIRESQRIFDNTPADATPERKLVAYKSLYAVAQSFESLQDYDTAIDRYRQVVDLAQKASEKENDEFYKLAARAQYQIGNIFFYSFHNYLAGWPEFGKVIQGFPASFEADQARTLLRETEAALNQIQQDQAYVRSKRKKKAVEYLEAGRKVLPTELYGVYAEQVAQTLLSMAQTWEKDPLRNREAAIKNYRLIVDELWTELFVAADAAFQIGRLYQDNGQYLEAIDAYTEMLERFPQAFRRDEAVYNRAVCYETIREFEKAYHEYKGALSLGENTPFFRAAEQKVRQMETDEDGDGYMFYQEQQAGTSDKDPNSYPGKKTAT